MEDGDKLNEAESLVLSFSFFENQRENGDARELARTLSTDPSVETENRLRRTGKSSLALSPFKRFKLVLESAKASRSAAAETGKPRSKVWRLSR